MFADSIHYDRDNDLSHLRLAGAVEIETLIDVKYRRRSFLALGLLVSVVLHLSLLWLKPVDVRHKKSSTILQVTIARPAAVPAPAKPEPSYAAPAAVKPEHIESADQRRLDKPVRENERIEKNIVKSTTVSKNSIEKKAKPLIPLSSTETREIMQQHSHHVAPQRGRISENVFHPGLRGRLEFEASKSGLRRVEGSLKTGVDPSGATLVESGGGKCLRSSRRDGIEPQDWYMTGCGGKSDSEEFLERVDQSVNGKLRFE